MREMKDSGVEWIGEIPSDWEICRFKNVGKGTNGLTYSPDNLVDEGQGILVLRSSNIQNGKLSFEDNVYVDVQTDTSKVRKGDILICSRNGSAALIGKNAIIDSDIEAYYGAFMMVFRSDEPEYMHYIMNSGVFDYYLAQFSTSTINQLTGSSLNNMRIPYCKDFIQKEKIVKYLDAKCAKIDSIIEKQQAIIEKLKEYKLSVITEAVTKGLKPNVEMKDSGIDWIGNMPSHWQRGRLSDVTDRIIVGLATSVTPYYRKSGMVLLRNLNIKEGYLDDEELLYLDEEFASSQIGKFIEKDDVLTVHTGSNLGLTCVVPDKYEHTLSFTTLITTPSKEKLDSFYLMYTINSGLGKSEIDKLKCGDIKPNLNVGQFKYFTVFVPPVSEQQEIVCFLNKKTHEIDNDILIKKQVIFKLQEYKKSLIYEVVTGKKEV